MKRDWELIRRIMFRAEETPNRSLDSSDLVDAEHDERSVADHVQQLKDAGLVEASVLRSAQDGPVAAQVDRLTWHGHEFLEAIRNDTVWSKTKDAMRKRGGAVTLDIVQSVATAIAKGMWGV